LTFALTTEDATMAEQTTILLVDNNTAVVGVVRQLLETGGFAVLVEPNIDRAERLLARTDIDLLVADVNPPEVDGMALVRRIKRDPATAETPVIVLTQQASLEDEFDAYLAGTDAYLTKPFRARDLLAAVRKLLDKSAGSSGGSRRAALNEVARVLAVVPDARRKAVEGGIRKAGFELAFETELSRALKRIDRERFHLLVCEASPEQGHDRQVREFMEHFALATPVIFFHPAAHKPEIPASDSQFRLMRLPVTPADLSEAAQRAIKDFGGPPF
jgi:CheY-like chemotaxis protein